MGKEVKMKHSTQVKRNAGTENPVAFEVYSPTGAIEITQLFSPRLSNLDGKVICELSNDSWETHRTFPAIRDHLQRRFPTAKIIPYTEFPQGKMELENAEDIGDMILKKGGQAVIVGNAA
jgi:hypothetical protein